MIRRPPRSTLFPYTRSSDLISALEARGLARKVLVTGQDAQLDAVQRIAAGTQTMTVYKPIKPLADSAVDSAVKLARSEEHTSELQSLAYLVCRLLLEKKEHR